jgi:hypothetical protein
MSATSAAVIASCLASSSTKFIVMRRAVLDSNGVDPLVDLPGAFDLVKRAIEAGELELLSTHVLAEQISAKPDPIKRAKLQARVDLARMVPTGAFILDRSPLDQARLRAHPAAVQALQAGTSAENTNDALIGMTGLAEHCAVITSDRRLRRKAIELGIEVLRPEELLTELGYTRPLVGDRDGAKPGVPHTCHDEWITTVIGSHSKALETTSDLRISRSSPSMK